MKIYFKKYFQLLEGTVLILLTVDFLKVIGLDMEINLTLYFRFLLILLVLFCFLESTKNKKELLTLVKKIIFLIKAFYEAETLKNQKLIIDFLASKLFGKSQKLNALCAKIFSPIFLISLPFRNIFLRSFILISVFLFIFLKSFGFDIYPLNFEIRFFFLIFFWLCIIFWLKAKPEISLINSISLLLVCPYYLIGERDLITAEKICLWAFIFLFIGIVHKFCHYVFMPKDYKTITYV